MLEQVLVAPASVTDDVRRLDEDLDAIVALAPGSAPGPARMVGAGRGARRRWKHAVGA